MIYIAVEGYRTIPHEVGKYLAILFGVTVFILCGFEHCVANMYYFTVGKAWSAKAALYILVMTLGNALGGVSIPLLRKAAARFN
jgi:formate/nitrite transporter FocA (FNT family)